MMKDHTEIKSLKAQQIQIKEFTYDLPEERIAKYPLQNREVSKLLVYKNGQIEESVFQSLSKHVDANCSMVFNNTKVIQARLIFHKDTGARVEIFCLEPLRPADYNLAFQAKSRSSWKCIVGNLRKWKTGVLNMSFYVDGKTYHLHAERLTPLEGAQEVQFSWDHPDLSFGEVLDQTGKIPIPPYLNRDSEDSDTIRYQTVYSKFEGSVAAPTAGLHFTESVLGELSNKGISREELTLHVGAGTFKPVKAENIGEHEMHTEHIQVDLKTISTLSECQHSIIAVGTTSVRSLESLYWMGVKLLCNAENPSLLKQWEAYQLPQDYTFQEAFQAIRIYMQEHDLSLFNAATQIIIAPGYDFKVIEGLVTNFHQPQSTLLLLISALVGEDWKKIYQYALQNDFRFLSYGDSSLLMRS